MSRGRGNHFALGMLHVRAGQGTKGGLDKGSIGGGLFYRGLASREKTFAEPCSALHTP